MATAVPAPGPEPTTPPPARRHRPRPARPRPARRHPAPDLPPTPASGLTEAEAARRRAAGLGNSAPPATSRTYPQILRENVFTFINNVIFLLGVMLVIVGRPIDALVSLGVIGTNIVVSVAQEVRAKRTLDRIALLTRPTATLVREGTESAVPPEDLVVGDLLRWAPATRSSSTGSLVDGSPGGRRVAADRRIGPRSASARATRSTPAASCVNGGGRLRRRGGRQRQPGEPDHRRGADVPARPDAAPERDQPGDPGGARASSSTWRSLLLLTNVAQARGRRRDESAQAARPRRADPERPVRVDRHRLRAGRGAPRALSGALVQQANAIESLQPRGRPVHRQDRARSPRTGSWWSGRAA